MNKNAVKFRNLETGEVFESIETALYEYCSSKWCNHCNLCDYNHGSKNKSTDCREWCKLNQSKAALLMNYEVVNEKENEDMENTIESITNTQNKPQICEILGVEVGEEFLFNGNSYAIKQSCNGEYHMYSNDSFGIRFYADVLCDAINHPERILRKPQFTKDEIAFMKVLSTSEARYIARDDDGDLYWYSEEPDWDEDVECWWNTAVYLGELPNNILLHIKPTQCINIEEVIGG